MAAVRLRLGQALVLSALCHGGVIAAMAAITLPSPPPAPAHHSVSLAFVHPPLTQAPTPPEPAPVANPQPKPVAAQRLKPAKPSPKLTPPAPSAMTTPTTTETAEASEPTPQPVRAAAAVETIPAPLPVMRSPDYLTPPEPPAYPPAARRLQIEGTVVVRALVERPGHPSQVTLWQSSGESLLDRSALEAVRFWRFRPMTHAGGTVAAWVEVPITFSMSNT